MKELINGRIKTLILHKKKFIAVFLEIIYNSYISFYKNINCAILYYYKISAQL